ncbi:concanavalin A-like lectin/glucanase [Sistotremastrum suecicum HHB10207 ss-3]|uniref:Concanavalin A-like lectin/glucanase n=1 Tax=Sistotremastrum suecicum HHB10207 ss-3 TaxID=1314776 RepID=A0A166GP79_9AGAM|nr:concanavalin A-like lectin/glucanase [Sistotremastrum suecicum HHB10207 ss-3]
MATSVLAFLLLLFIEPILAKQQVDEEFLRNNRTIERFVNIRTHSLHAPYIDQDLQNRWWDFGADAYVNTNKHIRLTRAVSSQMGWLWSRLPLTAIHYEIDVEFKVSGDSSHLYGDGFAMWLTRKRAEPGPLFGAPDYFEGLGIIVDTYANSRHSYGFPRIMAVLGDGKTHFDKDNDFDGQTLDACSANIRRASVATKLKVTYVKDELLEVKVQYKGWDEWTPCIKVRDVSLPTSPFLGFTALTGEVYDAHEYDPSLYLPRLN